MVVVASFVALVVVAAGSLFAYSEYRYHEIRRVTVRGLTAASADQPMNILMVGNNSRCVLSGNQSNAFGTCSEVGGARSDVIMILHLDPTTRRASILSIPRDLLVPVPGVANALKIDSALNYGPERLVQTIEDDFGITINHFVQLNFDSFQGVVGALGGIDMYFPESVSDNESALNQHRVLQTGCLHLNGFQALAEVRARHLWYYQDGEWNYDGNGDLSRIRRDHEFIRVLASQVEHRGLSNPLTVNSILGAVAPQLTVDSGLSFSTMVGLVERYHSTDPNSIPEITLPVFIDPVGYVYKGIGYADVVFPSEPFDQNAIDTWLGLTEPPGSSTDPSGIAVQVVNASGTPGLGTKAEQQLAAAGFSVSDGGVVTPVGSPAETLVLYSGKASLAAAQRVADNFSGAVMLQQGPVGPGSNVTVYVTSNSVVNAFTSGGPAAAGFTVGSSVPAAGNSSGATRTSAPAPAAHPSPTAVGSSGEARASSAAGGTGSSSASSTSVSTTAESTTAESTTTTSPIGVATNSQNPLQPWDPRSCPPGSNPVTAAFNSA